MTGHLLAAWLLASAPAPQEPSRIAQSAPDVQTIDRDVLTRPVETVSAAAVDRLIEVLFKVGARLEGSMTGAAAADARRELDRLRDDVAALHGRVRTGARGDGARYQLLHQQLLALAEKVGSPMT